MELKTILLPRSGEKDDPSQGEGIATMKKRIEECRFHLLKAKAKKRRRSREKVRAKDGNQMSSWLTCKATS